MEKQYYLVILFFIIVNLIIFIFLKYNGIKTRKLNYIELKQALENKESKNKMEKEEIEFLEKSLEKLRIYYIRWWFNLTPLYVKKQIKINKILKKYDLKFNIDRKK